MDSLPEDYFVTSPQFTRHVYQDPYPSTDPPSSALSLAGKVVVVVGAKRFVRAFAKLGIRGLVLIATDIEKLRAVEEEIMRLYPSVQTLSIGADIRSPASVDNAFAKTCATFGHADVLVNNGCIVAEAEGDLVADDDVDAWWLKFEVNTKGTFLVWRAFLRQLPSKETEATILHVVTSAAWIVIPSISGYIISKAGFMGLNQHIAGGYPNVTTVAMHPGLVDTDMLMNTFQDLKLETPRLVGGNAVWLSHPHAHFLSGRTTTCEWDVENLLERKNEMVNKDLLRLDMTGELGMQQFQ
ncbi:hypothetical protein GGI35DRAFT_483164 [Trichoderma velutinum]